MKLAATRSAAMTTALAVGRRSGWLAILLQGALDSAGGRIERPQFVALVDRSPKVQAVLLLWGSASTVWRLVGAAPVSTG